MISSWVTDAAPWRFEVPTQSDPVSPPPITTTCLPVAVIDPRGAARTSSSPATLLFCWVRNSIAKRTPDSSEPGISSGRGRSEEHKSELQSLMSSSYAAFCLKKKNKKTQYTSSSMQLDTTTY